MTEPRRRPSTKQAAPEPEPGNVIAALAAVMRELGGIEKLTPQQRQQRGLTSGDPERGISYAYRGVDQIAAKAQPLFGRYCVVIVPTEILASEVEPLVINSKPWWDTRIRVRWTIYGPGGVEDFIDAESEGVGRDNSDKGANKAITMAYKNLVLRLLTIGDPADDPDNEKVESSSHEEPKITEAQAEAIRAVINAIPNEADRAALRREVAERWGRTAQILARDGETVASYVTQRLRELTSKPAVADAGESVPETVEAAPVETAPELSPEAPTPAADGVQLLPSVIANMPVEGVKRYVRLHPAEAEHILAAERDGRERSTLIKWLTDVIAGWKTKADDGGPGPTEPLAADALADAVEQDEQ